MTPLAPPEGFTVVDVPGGALVAATDRESLEQAGLLNAARWNELLGSGEGTGRGATGRMELANGRRIVLKSMRRGGMAGACWRDRYAGARRLLDNLVLPCEARRRGVATPAPVALLALEGPPRLYRGWLALEEIAGSRDLFRRLASGAPPTGRELSAVMEVVRRMHDAGVDHRDLNLGNLLLREPVPGSPEAFVVDLDRARLHDGALGFRRRLRALRRLERSYEKHFARRRRDGDWAAALYERYAGRDAALGRRLARGRRAGRLGLLAHRLLWLGRGKG